MWQLYKRPPGFVLGFHGCDRSVGEKVLSGDERHLKSSNNAHDWLGSGIYFWESSPQRAWQWATDAKARPEAVNGHVDDPFVVGAIIDLGLCCNLFDSDALDELQQAYEVLAMIHDAAEAPMPKNEGRAPDNVKRYRDRAVIELMHQVRDVEDLPAYDSVRAAFGEGGPLYEGAGLTAKNHIQIAVRNPDCIKGYFRPLTKR